MPKRLFWPVAMIVMGLIFLASNMRMLPSQFWNLWPLILVVVGLGGLLISDKEEWDGAPKAKSSSSSMTSKTKSAKKPAKKAKKK
jgi:hypothetical protein